ncbi:metallophosphoesterase [Nocardioides sp.]|uniref:metallophosphoesterase family protein n=1 Tax=Nocardioides sp. TaxID=35761 RepID=UPI003512D925
MRRNRSLLRPVTGGLVAACALTLVASGVALVENRDSQAVDAAGAAGAAPVSTAATATTGAPTVTWTDTQGGLAGLPGLGDTVPSGVPVRARIDLAARAERVELSLRGARLLGVPAACRPSTVTRPRSYLEQDRLVCEPGAARSIVVDALTLGEDGTRVGGSVSAVATGGRTRADVPERTLLGGTATLTPDLRLLSSPDFLNGDVGDLARGPSAWTPQRSANSTNAAYETALDTVMDDWAALDPDAVLVAGDLVDGRWGYDEQRTGNFGPVDTPAQQQRAVRRAARTYYPQWAERFAERDLPVAPAMGDHEYGDNPWSARKRALAPTFKDEWARQFTRTADGGLRYPDHPQGPAAATAYAARPTPEVQIVTLDVFDITPARARLGLDPQQRRWLRGVLARAQRDGVEWIVVQGHIPVLWPVVSRGSSRLHYPGAARSDLWRLMKRYGVDLYLCGEVHDTEVVQRDGITQISHGGIFQFGLTTALTMDFYGDRLYLTLRDYRMSHSDAQGRLWETRREGMPADLRVSGAPITLGTAILGGNEVRSSSGLLRPTALPD